MAEQKMSIYLERHCCKRVHVLECSLFCGVGNCGLKNGRMECICPKGTSHRNSAGIPDPLLPCLCSSQTCEYEINECEIEEYDYCQNGKCADGEGDYICNCIEGFRNKGDGKRKDNLDSTCVPSKYNNTYNIPILNIGYIV